MRVDVVLGMQGEPGRHYAVVDDFYDGHSYVLTKLAYGGEPRLQPRVLDAALDLPRNPLPEPDLAAAARHELLLEGGVRGGMKGATGEAPPWDLNGMLTERRGRA